MTLYVETVDPALLPADIYRATRHNQDGAFTVPLQHSPNLNHYRGQVCDACGKPMPEHDWFAADQTREKTRVLRCSNKPH